MTNKTDSERRIIELEFYITIQLIYNIKKDADFLVTLLEGLRFIVPFDIEKVIYYANKFNLDLLWRPYHGEVIGVLFKHSKIPMQDICKALDVSRPTGYKLANNYLNEPFDTPPRVPPEDLKDLYNVVLAYNNLRKGMKTNV